MPILNPHGLGLSDAVDSYLEVQRKAKEEAAMAAIGQMMAGDLGAAPASTASPSPVFAPGAAQPAPSGPKLPTFAGVEGGAPSGNIKGLIANAAQKYGQDPNTLTRIAGVESSLNPNAKNPNSSAAGLFQFTSGTAKAYGLADPFNPAASADAAARLTRDNGEHLASTLGRAPTPGELYLAHQQGAGGAAKLLANPNARAGDVVGDAAVALNGGNPNMSAGQFAARWTRKFDGDKPIQPTVAQADLPAANAQAAQGFAIPGQAAPVASVTASPNDAQTRRMIGLMTQIPSMRPQAVALWASIRKGEDTWELGDFGAAGKGFYNKRNPSQRMMIPGSAKPEEKPASIKEYEYGQTDPEFFKRQDNRARAGAIRVGEAATEREAVADRLGLQGDERKQYVLNGKVPTAAEKDPTEGQSNAALYATRMRESHDVLSRPEAVAAMQVPEDVLLSKVPVAGNYAVPENYQLADQAQRNFVNAILRRESGAAISPSEFDNARKQYFPQPGDGPKVIEQKVLNRQTAIKGIEAAAGRALPRMEQRQAQSATAAGPAKAAAPTAPQITEGATATNPTTGAKIQFRGGQWVPVK